MCAMRVMSNSSTSTSTFHVNSRADSGSSTPIISYRPPTSSPPSHRTHHEHHSPVNPQHERYLYVQTFAYQPAVPEETPITPRCHQVPKISVSSHTLCCCRCRCLPPIPTGGQNGICASAAARVAASCLAQRRNSIGRRIPRGNTLLHVRDGGALTLF